MSESAPNHVTQPEHRTHLKIRVDLAIVQSAERRQGSKVPISEFLSRHSELTDSFPGRRQSIIV